MYALTVGLAADVKPSDDTTALVREPHDDVAPTAPALEVKSVARVSEPAAMNPAATGVRYVRKRMEIPFNVARGATRSEIG